MQRPYNLGIESGVTAIIYINAEKGTLHLYKLFLLLPNHQSP